MADPLTPAERESINAFYVSQFEDKKMADQDEHDELKYERD